MALKKARELHIGGQQARIERAVQRTRDTKQARHGRKRELQADARRGKRIGREQYGQCCQQRRRRVVLPPEQRRKKHQRRHERRAQHRRAASGHDDKHNHHRQADDGCHAPVAGEQTQKAQQKRQMQTGNRDRVHDTGRAERNVQILRVERGFIAEHERLRKRQHIRREGGLRARFERLGDGFRPVEPAAAPDAGAHERFVPHAADEVYALGNVGVRLLPVAQRGWAELHVRRDLVAGAQRSGVRIGDVEPRLAVGHVRACEQGGQPIAARIGDGILRHARRDRLHIAGNVLRGRQAQGRRRSVPPEANGYRQQRGHDPAARLPREQQRHEREHDCRERTGQHPARRQQKMRQKDRSRKSACAVCQLSHARSPLYLWGHYKQKRRPEQVPPPNFVAFTAASRPSARRRGRGSAGDARSGRHRRHSWR